MASTPRHALYDLYVLAFIARDLAEIASHIAQLKADARAYLSDPNYNTLELRLETAHSALEAAAVEARGGGCGSTRGGSLSSMAGCPGYWTGAEHKKEAGEEIEA